MLKGGDSLRRVGIFPNRGRKGQSLVEFAIALPLMVLIMFGVLDLGRAFFALITIHNAAREGARTATFDTSNVVAICNAAENEAISLGSSFTRSNISIGCNGTYTEICSLNPSNQEVFSGCNRGDPVGVRVSYDHQLVMQFLIPSPISMSRTVQMLAQR
jgi:hypothetical protein